MFVVVLFIIYFTIGGGSDESKTTIASRSTDAINLRKLLIASIVAAQRGGLMVVDVSKRDDFGQHSKGKTKEGVDDPVTEADFRSHCIMERGLLTIFPKLHVVSEEDGGERKCPDEPGFSLDPTVLHDSIKLPDVNVHASDLTVWIDPLDATKEYTERLFQYVTTMVCVAYKGDPIIGVIHNPFEEKTTWAWNDNAFSDDLAKVATRKEGEVENPVVIVSRSHQGDVKEQVQKIFGEKTRLLSAAGAGYKVLQVIFNNATVYLHTTAIKKWDLCAGNAILNSLSGKMTDLNGKEISYLDDKNYSHGGGILASMFNHDSYLEKVKEHHVDTKQQ